MSIESFELDSLLAILLLLLLLLGLSSFIIFFISSCTPSSLPVVYTVDDINDGSNPAATKTPVTASAMPAALATQMPLDHIFSPKIIPANRPIQSKFIHPRATMRRKYAQQQPRQYTP